MTDTDAARDMQNAQDLRMIWQDHIRRALGQPYLLMLMAGSLLLSVASFFTTFMGMLHFMPVLLVTFCIVFAIQALLFVTSWRIGFALADREGTPLFTLFVFLICICTSVFFSWVALFESINDEETQARTRQIRIQSAVEQTVAELKTRSLEHRREQMEALIASPAFVSWTDTVDRVAQEAMGARSALEAARDRAAAETANRIQALEAERERIMRGEAADAERVATNERTLTRLEEDRKELAERVIRLRSEVAEAEQKVVIQEGLMAAEETGGGDGRAAGRGPVWRQLRDDRNILVAERDAKSRLFESAASDLDTLEKRIEDLRAEIAAANASSGSAELAVLDRRLAELQDASSGAGVGQAAALESDVEQMRADISAFTSQFELAPFDDAAARCSDLLETMRAEPALQSKVAGLSCERTALAAFLNPIRNTNEAQRALAAACSPDGEAARNLSKLSFEEAVDYGRACIDRAGLPPEAVRDLRGEIARLVDEEDPNASQFVKTVNGFVAGDKQNFLALSIAIFIDLLVLFSGLIGALSASDSIARHFGRRFTRTQADNFIRALEFNMRQDETMPVARTLFAHMRPHVPEPSGFFGPRVDTSLIAKIDMTWIPRAEDRGVLQQFLLEQCAQGHAVIDVEQSNPNNGSFVFLLRKQVIDAVRDLYLRKSEDDVRNAVRQKIAADRMQKIEDRRQARQQKRDQRSAERKERLKARRQQRAALTDQRGKPPAAQSAAKPAATPAAKAGSAEQPRDAAFEDAEAPVAAARTAQPKAQPQPRAADAAREREMEPGFSAPAEDDYEYDDEGFEAETPQRRRGLGGLLGGGFAQRASSVLDRLRYGRDPEIGDEDYDDDAYYEEDGREGDLDTLDLEDAPSREELTARQQELDAEREKYWSDIIRPAGEDARRDERSA